MNVGGANANYQSIGGDVLNRYGASHYERGILGFFAGKKPVGYGKTEFEKYFSGK